MTMASQLGWPMMDNSTTTMLTAPLSTWRCFTEVVMFPAPAVGMKQRFQHQRWPLWRGDAVGVVSASHCHVYPTNQVAESLATWPTQRYNDVVNGKTCRIQTKQALKKYGGQVWGWTTRGVDSACVRCGRLKLGGGEDGIGSEPLPMLRQSCHSCSSPSMVAPLQVNKYWYIRNTVNAPG